jgi:hypothetical protein
MPQMRRPRPGGGTHEKLPSITGRISSALHRCSVLTRYLGLTSAGSTFSGILVMAPRHAHPEGAASFDIQGDGTESRSFRFVDDVVQGILRM